MIASLALLCITIGIMGTVAYFSVSFTSDDNTARAANFDVEAVNANGETIGDAQFNLDSDLVPGMDTLEAYQFEINKNSTDLPVEYMINLNPSGELFPEDGSSPIELTLQRDVEGTWVDIDYTTTFTPEYDVESFRVLVDWPHGENDIDFQGKTGNIYLEVVATQVEEEEETGPPYYTGEVIFKATPNGYTRTTENKEITFSTDEDGNREVHVFMGDDNPDGEFETKVGDLRIAEYSDDRGDWIQVYTEYEYYASETHMWRVKQESIDLSTPGVFKLAKSNKPHLTIESQELYDFFSN